MFRFSGLIDFWGLSLWYDHPEVVSFFISDPVLALNFEPLVIEMIVKRWDKEFVLNLSIDGNLNIDNPITEIKAFESESTVDIPLAQLRDVSNDVDGLTDLNFLLEDETIFRCRHAWIKTGKSLCNRGFRNEWQLLHFVKDFIFNLYFLISRV
jgi:hypothetical protein